jgi:hypothetical protein
MIIDIARSSYIYYQFVIELSSYQARYQARAIKLKLG